MVFAVSRMVRCGGGAVMNKPKNTVFGEKNLINHLKGAHGMGLENFIDRYAVDEFLEFHIINPCA